jgi:hypothetical protein
MARNLSLTVAAFLMAFCLGLRLTAMVGAAVPSVNFWLPQRRLYLYDRGSFF